MKVWLLFPVVDCFLHRHVSPSALSFQRVVVKVGAARRSNGASSFVARLNSKNVTNSEVSAALRGLVNGGPKASLEFNERDFTSLISAAARTGDWQLSKNMLHLMRGRSFDPNVFHYTAAISSCREERQQGPALEIFREMRLRGVKPNEITYNMLVSWLHSLKRARTYPGSSSPF